MRSFPTLTLRPGRERSVRSRHPWVFSGAVASVDGNPAAGDVVDLLDDRGRWQGRGYYSPESKIRVRVASWDRDDPLDETRWCERIRESIVRRGSLPRAAGRRLAFSESDGLPGLIVDRYDRWLSVQFLTVAAEARKEATLGALTGDGGPAEIQGVWERSEGFARELEGLTPRNGLLYGEEPPGQVTIVEDAVEFDIDLRRGHKTGFYLDQRENRRLVTSYLSGGSLLNAYAYTGGFGVPAARAGVECVINVDSSADALERASRNFERNGVAPGRVQFKVGDVPRELRAFRDRGVSFDAVVLDPPKFARGAAQLRKASRAYKDINLMAMKLLRPGGLLATFSCSGAMDETLFRKILAGAASDAGREVHLLRALTQADDHPMPLHFPEAAYLCGFLCRVR